MSLEELSPSDWTVDMSVVYFTIFQFINSGSAHHWCCHSQTGEPGIYKIVDERSRESKPLRRIPLWSLLFSSCLQVPAFISWFASLSDELSPRSIWPNISLLLPSCFCSVFYFRNKKKTRTVRFTIDKGNTEYGFIHLLLQCVKIEIIESI